MELYKEIINRYLSSNAKGEFFEGGAMFYPSARDYLTSEKNVKNKSVHCYAPLDYLVYIRSQDLLKNIDKTLPSWELSQIDTRLGPASIIPMVKELLIFQLTILKVEKNFLKKQ